MDMIKDGRLKCPNCGSDHVSTQEVADLDGAILRERMICNDCDAVTTL